MNKQDTIQTVPPKENVIKTERKDLSSLLPGPLKVNYSYGPGILITNGGKKVKQYTVAYRVYPANINSNNFYENASATIELMFGIIEKGPSRFTIKLDEKGNGSYTNTFQIWETLNPDLAFQPVWEFAGFVIVTTRSE